MYVKNLIHITGIGKKGSLKLLRTNYVKWSENLRECNNHRNFIPAFSLRPSGSAGLVERCACQAGAKYYLCKKLPAVQMGLPCAIRMYTNVASKLDGLPVLFEAIGTAFHE